jgi:hypothetical protein
MKIPISVFIFIFISLATIDSVPTHRQKLNINWNGNNWAFPCDFNSNDLSNIQIHGEDVLKHQDVLILHGLNIMVVLVG